MRGEHSAGGPRSFPSRTVHAVSHHVHAVSHHELWPPARTMRARHFGRSAPVGNSAPPRGDGGAFAHPPPKLVEAIADLDPLSIPPERSSSRPWSPPAPPPQAEHERLLAHHCGTGLRGLDARRLRRCRAPKDRMIALTHSRAGLRP